MDPQIARIENAQREQSTNLKTTDATTSKLPFKDATNSTSGKTKEESQNPQVKKLELEINNDFFHRPSNMACFCCGDERKLDGEILFKNLVSAEFLDLLDSHLRIPERECSPPSPIKIPPLEMFEMLERPELTIEELPAYECELLPVPVVSYEDGE